MVANREPVRKSLSKLAGRVPPRPLLPGPCLEHLLGLPSAMDHDLKVKAKGTLSSPKLVMVSDTVTECDWNIYCQVF